MPKRTYGEYFGDNLSVRAGQGIAAGARALGPITEGIRRRSPDIAVGAVAAPYVIPPVIRAYRTMFGLENESSDPNLPMDPQQAGSFDDQMEALMRQDTPAMQASPPQMQGMGPGVPGANIDRLRKMLQT